MGPKQIDRLLCTAKETNKQTKRQLTEWEKILLNDATDKGLISRIYKQLIQLKSSQQPNGKMGKGPEQTFFQGRCTDGQQAHEKMLNIADLREMHIKSTMRYHLTPVRMAIINKSTNNKCQRGCGEKEPSCNVGRYVHW